MPEVLIAGAGPVGQFAALALAKRGVEVRIVDRGVWPCAQSYALALHPESLRLFREAGILGDILESAHPVHSVAIYDESRLRTEIPVDEDGVEMAVVRQDRLEGLLEKALGKTGVRVQWRHEIPSILPGAGAVHATIDRFEKETRGYVIAHTEWVLAKSTEVDVPFVIGADGYNSRVRRALKIDFAEGGTPQYYAVFEFGTDAQLGEQARIVLGERTTDVLWPLPGGACRWSFELPDYHDAAAEEQQESLRSAGFERPAERTKDRLPAYAAAGTDQLTEDHLKELIAERAPWFAGSIGRMVWHSVIRFERRLASSFGRGRAWLAGDSAHLTGPIGVQSMNLGLQEAAELADIMAGVLRRGDSLDRFNEYNARWTATWRELHGPNRLLACLPAHGQRLAAMAAKAGG